MITIVGQSEKLLYMTEVASFNGDMDSRNSTCHKEDPPHQKKKRKENIKACRI